MSFFNRSKIKILKQIDIDIWDYCFLNPFKYNNYLRKSFSIKYNRVSLSRQELENSNLLVKADKRLKKLFLKKKSYFSKLLVLKRKLRLFFNFFTDNFIEKFFISLFVRRKKYRENFYESLSIGLETFLFFFLIRLRYVFSFQEADIFIKQEVILVENILVKDAFFNIQVGDIVSCKSLVNQVFFFKRHYIYWFNEFVRQGLMFNKIFLSFFIRNYYVSSKVDFLKKKFFSLRFPSLIFNKNHFDYKFLVGNFLNRNIFFFRLFFYNGNLLFKDNRVFSHGILNLRKNLGHINFFNSSNFSNIKNQFFDFSLVREFKKFKILYFFLKFYYCFISLKKIVNYFLVDKIIFLNKLKNNLFNKFYGFKFFYFFFLRLFFLCLSLFLFRKLMILFFLTKKLFYFNIDLCFFFKNNILNDIHSNTVISNLGYFIFKFFSFYFDFFYIDSFKIGLFLQLIFKKYRSFKRFFINVKKLHILFTLNKYFLINKSLNDFFFLTNLNDEINCTRVMESVFVFFGKRLSRSFSLWNFDLIEKAFNYNEFVLNELKKKKQIHLLKGRTYSNILWKDDRDLKTFSRMVSLYKFKLNNVKVYYNNLENLGSVKMDFSSEKNNSSSKYKIIQKIVGDLKPRLTKLV